MTPTQFHTDVVQALVIPTVIVDLVLAVGVGRFVQGLFKTDRELLTQLLTELINDRASLTRVSKRLSQDQTRCIVNNFGDLGRGGIATKDFNEAWNELGEGLIETVQDLREELPGRQMGPDGRNPERTIFDNWVQQMVIMLNCIEKTVGESIFCSTTPGKRKRIVTWRKVCILRADGSGELAEGLGLDEAARLVEAVKEGGEQVLDEAGELIGEVRQFVSDPLKTLAELIESAGW